MEGTFFPRCADDIFWTAKERVSCLIEVYHVYECLWNVKSPIYKNITRKKSAKVTIGTHFGLSGLCLLLFLYFISNHCHCVYTV